MNIKRKIKCWLGFHEYKSATFNLGMFVDKSGSITTLKIHGEECIYCGHQHPIDEHLASAYNNTNDYTRGGYQ